MKVKIKLKAVRDMGTIKTGDTMELINEVFCEKTGVAFYPIERKDWTVTSSHLWSGMVDKNKKDIFEGDRANALIPGFEPGELPILQENGQIVYDVDFGGWCFAWPLDFGVVDSGSRALMRISADNAFDIEIINK